MGKDRRLLRRRAIASGAAVLLAAVLIAGCRNTDYKRIELENKTQPAEEQMAGEIRIGDGNSSGIEDSGIVIRQDEGAGSGEDGLSGTGKNGAVSGFGDAAQNSEETGFGVEQSDSGQNGEEPVLLFAGDVLLSSHVLNAYQKAGGIHGVLDEGYRNVIRDADFFMVNEEFPFSTRGVQAEDKQYTFRLEPERVSLFQEMGIDAVTLANNHALDFGVDALLDSITTLDSAGILHTGAGADLAEARRPVEAELGGRQVAVIGATRVIPVASWAAGKNHPGMLSSYDATALLEEIRAQKAEEKFVIVYVHWGIERDERPQDYQRTLGQQYIDAGADLVIGSHPHVLQGIEYYKEKPIVYSLGNFVFGSSIPRTMLLEVKLPREGEDSVPGLRLIPGTSGAGYTRMFGEPEKLREFYQYMESISFGISIGEDGTVNPQDQKTAQP